MDFTRLITELGEHKGVRFVSFPHTEGSGRERRRLVYVGGAYEDEIKKDVETLEQFLQLYDCGYVASVEYSKLDWKVAVIELLMLMKKPIRKRTKGEKNDYVELNELGNIKLNLKRNELMVQGVLVSRNKKHFEDESIIAMTTPSVTLVKNLIRKHYLSTGRWRAYRFKVPSSFKVNGDTIVFKAV